MMRAFAAGLMLVYSLRAQPSQLATLATPVRATSFVLAKTGRLAGAVCEDGKLLLWTLPEGRMLRTIDLGRNIDIVAMSEDGGWIAAGDHGGSYTVWDTSTGARQMHVQMPFYPFALAFSPDGKRLAIAPVGEPVEIYDPASGQKLFELPRTTGGSAAVSFSRDGGRIATADTDTVVRIYDARNGEMLARNAEFLLVPLTAAFTPDGKQLVTAGGDKVIALLDAATGNVIRKSTKAADPVLYMHVSPDGALVAAMLMHADNMLMAAPLVISETASGREVQEWLPPSLALGGGWTKDGRLLVATATEKALHIWRVR
jgi:dipeptidyl aminopeptidase/acylaminoacyl peptidase